MKYKRYMRVSWALLLTILMLGLMVTPAGATSRTTQQAAQHQGTATLGATIYLSKSTLWTLFQNTLNAQLPGAINGAILGLVGKLPPQDQGWAYEMATTLIQPSASLVSLSPQRGGLATTVSLSLYPGDPKPITSSMLISFSVANSSTAQVSASPLNGSPALVNGPLTSIHIPLGQLNSIRATPNCSDSALAVNVRFPVSIGPLPTPPPPSGLHASLNAPVQPHTLYTSLTGSTTSTHQAPGGVASYVEVPASSLAAIGSAIGSWQINDSLTAQNIQIGTNGSNLTISADIYLGTAFRLARTLTLLAPSASGGNLVVHVLNTYVTIFEIFTFPYDVYNWQIEQILNSVLSSALGGKFYVTNAVIGPNSHVSCAAGDSLMLTGTTNIG